ncbi:DUF4129 domain-containing protein [Kitasatospora nipponensis]|uniref:DUF4129 domain-containing protein n=1 Tax=Kitasatospora nipponensis TaxID=258049 RepID=A0ABN1WSL6_9ACTN
MTRPQDPPSRPGPGPRAPGVRPALAALAVAGLAFAALVLHPAGGLVAGGAAPLNDLLGPVILLCLGWMLFVDRIFRRYRTAVRTLEDLPPRAERLRGAALRVLPFLALAVPVALLLAYRASQPPAKKSADDDAGGAAVIPHRTTDGGAGQHPPHVAQHTGLLHLVVLVFEIALPVVVLVAALLVWRRLRRVSFGRVQVSRRAGLVAGTDTGLARAVDSARRALHGSDARAAVIACYVAMEDSLAATGVARQIADSPTDLLERAVADGVVRASDAGALTALFREARFSRHPMDQTHLARARAALDAIAAHLPAAPLDTPVEANT